MTQYKGAFVMFLLALSSPAPAAAQDGGGFGRVVDKTGAVLPGSTVALYLVVRRERASHSRTAAGNTPSRTCPLARIP